MCSVGTYRSKLTKYLFFDYAYFGFKHHSNLYSEIRRNCVRYSISLGEKRPSIFDKWNKFTKLTNNKSKTKKNRKTSIELKAAPVGVSNVMYHNDDFAYFMILFLILLDVIQGKYREWDGLIAGNKLKIANSVSIVQFSYFLWYANIEVHLIHIKMVECTTGFMFS